MSWEDKNMLREYGDNVDGIEFWKFIILFIIFIKAKLLIIKSLILSFDSINSFSFPYFDYVGFVFDKKSQTISL